MIDHIILATIVTSVNPTKCLYILMIILINAAKTMSEWMKLRALNHPNIIGFDDEDSGTGHWLPTTTEGISDDPEGQC